MSKLIVIAAILGQIVVITLWKVGEYLNYYGPAITGISTAIIVYLTWTIWRTNRDQLRHSEQVERAYVTLRHERPGLNIDLKEGGWAWVTMRVTNFGQTPATVTDAVIKLVTLPVNKWLPDTPDYTPNLDRDSPRIVPKGFLVTNDQIFFGATYHISTEVVSGQQNCWLIGYVDYIDQFGKRHRGGYARRYDPPSDSKDRYGDDNEFRERNNLRFIQVHGYNYDRPRQKGEGNDWDKAL
jgi:hypothetical protein